MSRDSVPVRGELVRAFREGQALTQEAFEAQYHISARTLSRIENENRASLATINLLLEILGCRSSDLVAHGTPILLRLAKWRERLQDTKRVALTELLCSGGQTGVPITVVTLETEYTLELRLTATIGQLAYAVAKAYFPTFDPGRQTPSLTADVDGRLKCDDWWTMEQLRSEGITRLILWSSSGSDRLVVWSPYDGTSIVSVVRRLRKGRWVTRGLLSKLSSWIWRRRWLEHSAPPQFVVRSLNNMACHYAEANAHLDTAMRYLQIVERSDLGAEWQVMDTAAWILYRLGCPEAALDILTRTVPVEAVGDMDFLYHLYFISQACDETSTATAVRSRFTDLAPELEWDAPSAPQMVASWGRVLFRHTLACWRVRMNDDCFLPG